MTSKWRIEPLREVVSYIAKGIPPAYVEEESETTVRVLNQKCNRDFVINYGESRLHDLSQRNVPQEKYLRDEDILINSTGKGTAGRVAQLNKVIYPTIIDGHMIVLRPNEKLIPQYLGYALKAHQGEILQMDEGSTGQTELNRERLLSELIVSYPVSLDEQRAIANTLSALDERIDINGKINHHLEQMAQAIFKSWFVDLDPFNGDQPPEWRKGTLGDYVVIRRGGSPRPIHDFLSDSGLRWLKISDVTALLTPFVLQIKEHIKESGLRKTVFLKSGSLVLSNSATPGIPKILGVDTCIHDGWLYFPTSHFSTEFLYLFFKHIRQDLVALGNGSVFTNLKTDILKSFPVVTPDEATLKRFDETVRPIFKEMENRTRESAHIADLRDSLLPRLMSGELCVADVDAK